MTKWSYLKAFSSEMDKDWWAGYRIELQNKFRGTNYSFGRRRLERFDPLRVRGKRPSSGIVLALTTQEGLRDRPE